MSKNSLIFISDKTRILEIIALIAGNLNELKSKRLNKISIIFIT